MGISTVASPTPAPRSSRPSASAQELVDEYFTGTVSRLGGIGLDELAAEVAARHRARLPRPARGAGPPQPRARRRVPVAARGRVPPLQPGDGVQAAARHPGRPLRHLQAVHRAWSTTRRGAWPRCGACSSSALGDRPPVPDRRGRAGQRDRQALLHRGHELRLDLGRGPRDPGHRHEPPRRQVQHRRGRRGRRALRARLPNGDSAALGHQAGGVGPLRRHQRVPGQRRRPADQDGPGGQAGRGRPAARPQGVPVDRQDPALHAGRRA